LVPYGDGVDGNADLQRMKVSGVTLHTFHQAVPNLVDPVFVAPVFQA
jgi:hypothetical protein